MYRVGDVIRIIHIENGSNTIDDHYDGVEGVVDYVSSDGRLFGSWGEIAVVPNFDRFTLIGYREGVADRYGGAFNVQGQKTRGSL